MIKIVSLDIGGTLLEDFHDNSSNYNLKELTKLVDMPYEIVRDVYKNIFQKTKGTFEELIEKFCNKLGINNSDDLINFFKGKFSNNNMSNPISNDKISLINNLKNNGYKVILFSNNCSLFNNDAIKEIYDLVDGVFYSYDIGYTKDDKESYQYVEKTLNVKPNEILHIGDTLKSDYLKPIENGWNALFYGDSDDGSVNCISSLMELYDFFDIRKRSN